MELMLNNLQCTKCPLSELRSNVVNGIGPVNARIMIVGEAPGTEEDLKKMPFIGKAGQKLDMLLSRAGIHRSQVYLTNATRCFPRLRTIEGFRAPHFEEGQSCLSYLEQEIAFVKPNIIVPIGSVALQALMGTKKAKITEFRGKEVWLDKYNVKCFPTFHPSAVLRNPNLEDAVVRDFKRIVESSEYKEMTPPIEGNYVVIDSIEKFDQFYERIMQQKEVAIDLETTGFDWQKDKIICASFSWKSRTGVLLPITKWIGVEHEHIKMEEKKVRRKNKPVEIKLVQKVVKEVEDTYQPWWKEHQDYVVEKFRRIMESDISWIGQNLKFDWKFFLQMGWKVKPAAYDTLLLHYLLHETAKGEHDLESMSIQYLGRGQHKKELEDWFVANKMAKSDERNYARVPTDILFKYGASDADVTLELKEIMYPIVVQQGMDRLFHNLVMPLDYNLTVMEFEGFKIDLKALNKAKEDLQRELVEKEKEIRSIIGNNEININSSLQLCKLFYEDLKLPIAKTTPKGAPSVDEEALGILSTQHEVALKIVEYRSIAKLLSTYVLGVEERLDDAGRLHATYLQQGTECVTKDTHIWTKDGLLTIEELLQHFPKEKKFKPYKIGLVNRFGKIENTSHLYNGGKRKTIKIKTALGLGLVATPEHPLLVLRGNKLIWETLKNIKVGDFIQSSIGNNVWGNSTRLIPSVYTKRTNAKTAYFPSVLTPKLARLVGYWIAEGCYIHTGGRFGIRITNRDEKIIKDIIDIAKELFHITVYLHRDNSGTATAHLISKELYEWWISNFGYQHGAKNKYVPTIIKRTNWKIIKEFLRGLSTDSCIGLYKDNRNGLRKPLYKFSVDSKQLVLEVQQLLLNAGFVAKFYKARKYKYGTYKTAVGEYFSSHCFQVVLNGHEAIRFLNEVPPIVPVHIERMKDFAFTRHVVFDPNTWFRNNPYIRFRDNKWYLKVIKKINYTSQDVFDFTLPKTHSFVTNGLISHNSGRLSSRNPNLQNIPRDNKIIKNMFVVEDGNVLVEADEGQIEFRWWGIYSNDPQLVRDLNDGVDIHRRVAALANSITEDAVTKEQRQKAKSIVFGLMFSMGTKELSKQHNVTLEYAEHVKNTFFSRYPVAKQWRYDIVKFAKRNLYVQSLFGRRRHLLGINHPENKISYPDEQGAINSPIQGSASDYTTNAANRIVMKFKELGLRGRLRNLVHDAIYMEIPKTELDQSVKIMKEEMERRILGIQIPLKAEFKIGTRWSDLKEVKVDNDAQNLLECLAK